MNVKSKALVVFMKFMKTHVFIQCIRNVIIHIDILLSDSEDLDINICFPNISLKFEDNLFAENGQYMFEKQPDAILFNNAQIVNAGLHDSIRKLRPRYIRIYLQFALKTSILGKNSIFFLQQEMRNIIRLHRR